MFLEFKHDVSQKSIIREMDFDELMEKLKTETNAELILFIKEQIRQISGKISLN